MTLLAFIVATVSTFFWALFDLARKTLAGKVKSTVLLFQLSSVQALLCIFVLVLFEDFHLTSEYWVAGISALFVSTLGRFTFLESVREGRLSDVIPLLSLTPVWTYFCANLLMGTSIELRDVIGVGLISFGCFKVVVGPSFRMGPPSRSTWLMVITSILFSLTVVFDKIALDHAGVFSHFLVQATGTSLIVLGLNLKKIKSLCSLKSPHLVGVFWGGLVSVLAIGLQFWALTLAPAAYVEALKRSVGILLSLVLGKSVLKESVSAAKWGYCLVIAVGVSIICM